MWELLRVVTPEPGSLLKGKASHLSLNDGGLCSKSYVNKFSRGKMIVYLQLRLKHRWLQQAAILCLSSNFSDRCTSKLDVREIWLSRVHGVVKTHPEFGAVIKGWRNVRMLAWYTTMLQCSHCLLLYGNSCGRSCRTNSPCEQKIKNLFAIWNLKNVFQACDIFQSVYPSLPTIPFYSYLPSVPTGSWSQTSPLAPFLFLWIWNIDRALT